MWNKWAGNGLLLAVIAERCGRVAENSEMISNFFSGNRSHRSSWEYYSEIPHDAGRVFFDRAQCNP